MSKMLYLIGEPAAGKTTLVRALTEGIPSEVCTEPYVAWTHYSDDVCQLGYDRETFGGTDALGMAAQKHVLDWLEHRCEYKYIIAEGDRLANGKFFDAVREMGVDLTVAVLLVSQKRLDSRRRKRNAALGKEQDERWLKTRATKVQNLRRYCDREIDGRMPLEEQVKLLKLEPVGRVLARLRVKARNA